MHLYKPYRTYIDAERRAHRFSRDCQPQKRPAFSRRKYSILKMKRVSDTNRNKFEIIAEILRQIRVPTGKTRIMSRCNMNNAQSDGYLKFMKSSDLIRIAAVAGKVTYQRTESGLRFLELYSKMALLLDQNILAPSLMWEH